MGLVSSAGKAEVGNSSSLKAADHGNRTRPWQSQDHANNTFTYHVDWL